MSNKEKSEKINSILSKEGIFTCEGVNDINHKPHPYTIGSKHITHASDNHGGMLGEATLKAVPCAVLGCNLPYDSHTYDTVAFLKFAKDITNEEANNELKSLVAKLGNTFVDGFAFIESSFKIIE